MNGLENDYTDYEQVVFGHIKNKGGEGIFVNDC